MREGCENTNLADEVIGKVTSGGFARPSRCGVVAMSYLPTEYTAVDAEVLALVRGKPVRMQVTKMPFRSTKILPGINHGVVLRLCESPFHRQLISQ